MKKIIIVVILLLVIALGVWYFLSNNKNVPNEPITYNFFKLYENDLFGVININGDIVIKPEYEEIIIPNPGKPVFICLNNYNLETDTYAKKIMNETGEIFTEYEEVEPIEIESIISTMPYETNMLKYKQNDLWGLLDIDGNQITKPIYSQIKSLPNKPGEFLVKQDSKYGVLNSNGKVVLDIKYASIEADGYTTDEGAYTDAGYIVSTTSDKGIFYSYLNSKTKKILDEEYSSLYRIVEKKDDKNAYIIAARNGQFGLFKDKKNIIECKYSMMQYNQLNDSFIVQRNEKYGVLDINGNTILPIEYDFLEYKENYIIAHSQNTVQSFDKQGNKISDGIIYKSEASNYYITIENERYGVLDLDKKTIIETKYDYIEFFDENTFIVIQNSKLGLMDTNKNTILDIKYEFIQKIPDTQLIQIYTNNILTILDKDKKEIVSLKNGYLYQYDNFIKLYSDEKIIYLDNNGNIVEEPKIEEQGQPDRIGDYKREYYGYSEIYYIKNSN